MKQIISTFIFLVFSFSSIFSQLQKKDILLGFQSNMGHTRQPEVAHKSIDFNFSPTIGYMLTDKLMAGAAADISLGKGESSFSGNTASRTIRISPFARYYYLDRNRFRPYMFAYFDFYNYRYKREMGEGSGSGGWIGSAAGGFGAHYFLSTNFAIQADIGTTFFQNKNDFGYDEILFANIGLITFINDTNTAPKNMMANYLCKGNYRISGSANLTIDDNDGIGLNGTEEINAKPQEIAYSLSPSLQYFTDDRTAITIAPSINGNDNGTSKRISIGLGAGIEKYWPVGERLFFVPTLFLRAYRARQKIYTTDASFIPGFPGGVTLDTVQKKYPSYSVNGSLDISLKYFTESACVLSLGSRYAGSHYYLKESDFRNTSSNIRLYTSLEYFFAENISFTTTLSYSKWDYHRDKGKFIFIPKNDDSIIGFNLSFGISYFIFNKKCKPIDD